MKSKNIKKIKPSGSQLVKNAIIKDPTLVPVGVSILRVDYDHSPELKKKYKVVTQHTFVQIDANENVLGMWVGGDAQSLPEHIR
jgi:hypothetical protein